jgi:hypothetical protein
MKAPLWIVLAAAVFVTGSTLAIMNSACKSGYHSWCAPSIRHPVKTGNSQRPRTADHKKMLRTGRL